MKKLGYLLLVIMFISCMTAPAFASEPWTTLSGRYEYDAPEELYLYTFGYVEPDHPLEHFQNSLHAELLNGETTHHDFYWSAGSEGDFPNADFTLTLDLEYSKNALRRYNDVFITGSFALTQVMGEETTITNGSVRGQLVVINPFQLNLGGSDSDDVNAVVLMLSSNDNGGFEYNFFLNPATSGLFTYDYGDEIVFYFDHESRPHVPTPSRQADVAAGVGLSTVGIAIANALTKTTAFGNASFNGSFDPTAATPGSSAASGAAGAAGASAPAAGTGASAATGSSGGFVGVVKEFFRGLFNNLKDMLTDEGRSYASGRLAETLDDISADDIDSE